MERDIKKFHPNLEGRSVLVVESGFIVPQIIDRLNELERMESINGLVWPIGKDGNIMNLKEWVQQEKAEAVLIHPYDNDCSIKEIIQLHKEGCRIVVIAGNENVDEERIKAYNRLRQQKIPVVTKDFIIGSDGRRIFLQNLSDELSELFK